MVLLGTRWLGTRSFACTGVCWQHAQECDPGVSWTNDCRDGEDGRRRTQGMPTSRERNVLFGDGSGKAVTNRGLERHWLFTF